MGVVWDEMVGCGEGGSCVRQMVWELMKSYKIKLIICCLPILVGGRWWYGLETGVVHMCTSKWTCSIRCWSGAGQVSFVQEQVDKFRC